MTTTAFRVPAEPVAVLYVRLSSYELGSSDAEGVRAQEDGMRGFCDRAGWKIAGTVTDLDVSGSDLGLRLDRPGIQEIRRMVETGAANIVVVAKADRLARDIVDYKIFLRGYPGIGWPGLATYGATAASTDGIIRPEDPEDIGSEMSMVIAGREAKLIRQRTGDGSARARSAGRAVGSVPYGYRIEANPAGPGKIVLPDPAEAPVVARIIRSVVAGATLSGIARMLNGERVLTRPRRPRGGGESAAKAGRRWSVQTLDRLARNPVLVGRQIHRGQVVLGADGMPRTVAEPLVPVDLWMCAVAILDGRRPSNSGRRAARILSGLLGCAECGARLRVQQTSARARYVCSGDGCRTQIAAGPTEQHIIDALLGRYGDIPVYRGVVRERADSRRSDALGARERLSRELAGDITEERADEIATQLRSIRRLIADLPPAPEKVTTVEATGETVRQLWDRSDTDGRRGVISALPIGAILVTAATGVGRRIDPGARVHMTDRTTRPTATVLDTIADTPSLFPGAPSMRTEAYVVVGPEGRLSTGP